MTTSKTFKKRIEIQQISIKNIKGKKNVFLPISEVKYFYFWYYFNFWNWGIQPWRVPWIILTKIALHTKLCFMYMT